MLRIRGSQALSAFRTQKLLVEAKQLVPQLEKIDSEFQHLINLNDGEALSSKEHEKLESLLEYGPAMREVEHVGQRLYVVPRIGTISPWSTKATDIVRHCGLDKVKRIERGIAYYLKSATDLDAKQMQLIKQLLHDPMTESVVPDLQAAGELFVEEAPKALFEVPFLQKGKDAIDQANQELVGDL